jgi:HTH-type transcriptional regulator / antitoxin HipB
VTCHNIDCFSFPYGNNLGKSVAYTIFVTVREYLIDFGSQDGLILPYGNIWSELLKYTPTEIGELVRDTRKRLGVTQKDLALTAGTGLRFVIDLERGKETCELGKSLRILQTLGITVTLTPPASEG